MQRHHIVSAAVALLSAAALTPPRTWAHTFLDHATPRVGSTVHQSPDAVTLTFTEPIEPDFSRVEVLDARDHRVETGPVEHPRARTKCACRSRRCHRVSTRSTGPSRRSTRIRPKAGSPSPSLRHDGGAHPPRLAGPPRHRGAGGRGGLRGACRPAVLLRTAGRLRRRAARGRNADPRTWDDELPLEWVRRQRRGVAVLEDRGHSATGITLAVFFLGCLARHAHGGRGGAS